MGSNKPQLCPHGIKPKGKCKKCKREYQKEYQKKNPDKRTYRDRLVKNQRALKKSQRKYKHSEKGQGVNRKAQRNYYCGHREELLQRNRECRKELKRQIGDKCIICSFFGIVKVRDNIEFHELNLRKHNSNPCLTLNHTKDFIPLCINCHHTLHRLLRFPEQFKKLLEIYEII